MKQKLKEEINQDRAVHGKKPLKDKDDEGDGDTGRVEEKGNQGQHDRSRKRLVS